MSNGSNFWRSNGNFLFVLQQLENAILHAQHNLAPTSIRQLQSFIPFYHWPYKSVASYYIARWIKILLHGIWHAKSLIYMRYGFKQALFFKLLCWKYN